MKKLRIVKGPMPLYRVRLQRDVVDWGVDCIHTFISSLVLIQPISISENQCTLLMFCFLNHEEVKNSEGFDAITQRLFWKDFETHSPPASLPWKYCSGKVDEQHLGAAVKQQLLCDLLNLCGSNTG